MNELRNKKLKDILKSAKNVTLEANEKNELNKKVLKFVKDTPPFIPILSPFVMKNNMNRLYWYDSLKLSLLSKINNYSMPIAIFLVLALSAGTSFAAQGSIPGDVLYPVKINVNENVESFVAVSAKAKAEVEAKHAIRRLEEAEKLESKGELSVDSRAEVKARFSEDVEAMKRHREELKSKGETEAVLDLDDSFQARVNDHSKIFIDLSGDSTGTEAEGSFNSILKMGGGKKVEAEDDSEMRDEKKSGSASTTVKVDANVRGDVETDSKSVETDSSGKIEIDLDL